MLSDERLAEITKLCQDAHLGYAAPKVYDYAKDIGQLLEERRQLLERLEALTRQEIENEVTK